MIEEFSFKNFRKFPDFPPMKLKGLNILVGPNNAGKSSVTKALLLFIENLQNLSWGDGTATEYSEYSTNWMTPYFHFDAHQKFDLHIGTFKNALFAGTQRKSITFSFHSFFQTITIEIAQVEEIDNVACPIKSISIYNNQYESTVSLDFSEMRLTFSSKFSQNQINQIQNNNSSFEALKNLANSFEKKITGLETKSGDSICESMPIVFPNDENVNLNIFNLINNTVQHAMSALEKSGATKEKKSLFANPAIGENAPIISHIIDHEQFILNNIDLHYIPVHSVTQKRVLNKADKNDFLAQAVHNFFKLRIKKGDPADKFLTDNIKAFEIGEGYRITSLEGEAYIVEIKDRYGWGNLASKGMGNIQLFTLCLQLAYFITVNPDKEKWAFFEEPELNLHPKFQSMLADLFYSASQNGCCCFVETHSEYLVRRTQVLVAKEHFENHEEILQFSPFYVVYFKENDLVKPFTPMHYHTTGAFKEQFGEGFYDEASNLDMIIMRNELIKDGSLSEEDVNKFFTSQNK